MEHPIQNFTSTVMENIKKMVDVNTVIGEPVETGEGTVIIPVSRVAFGFAVGGSDFGGTATEEKNFGGGSGAGVSVSPVGFLVVSKDQIKLMPVTTTNTTVDKLLDYVPLVFDKVDGMVNKNKA